MVRRTRGPLDWWSGVGLGRRNAGCGNKIAEEMMTDCVMYSLKKVSNGEQVNDTDSDMKYVTVPFSKLYFVSDSNVSMANSCEELIHRKITASLKVGRKQKKVVRRRCQMHNSKKCSIYRYK